MKLGGGSGLMVATLFFAGPVLTGAALTGPVLAAPAPRPVTIQFALEAGGKPVSCAAPIAGLGATKATARLHDARFYISEIALIDRDGKETPVELEKSDWQFANVALLDFDDKSGNCQGSPATNAQVKGTVPAGRYKGLRFTLGVPVFGRDAAGKEVSLNHSDTSTAPAPLDLPSMSWSWQAGRKFVKIEIDPEGGVTRQPPKQRPAPDAVAKAEAAPAGEKPGGDAPKGEGAKGEGAKNDAAPAGPANEAPALLKTNADGTITVATWALHLGSTGCKGNPATGEIVACGAANRVPVTFVNFNPDTQRVALDLDALLAGVDVTRDGGGATGCMSAPADPECAPVFERLGLAIKESAPGAGDAGKPQPAGQRIFRAEAKK
jgi:hypothetical protein